MLRGEKKILNIKIHKIKSKYNNIPLPLKVSFWYFFCSLLQKGISFITLPIFTRVLSTEEYGVISIYNSWEQIIIIFLTLNLSNSVFNVGLVRFDNDRDNFQSSMVGLEIIITLIMSLILFLVYNSLIPIIQLDYRYIFIMTVQCFFTIILGMWTLRQRFDYNYKKMTIVSVLNIILGVLVSLVLVFMLKDKSFGKISGTAIILMIIGLFCFFDMVKGKKSIVNFKYWKFALLYNIPMIPHFISSVILNQLDRIMIQNMIGLSEAGIYSVAYSSACVVYILNQALAASYNPWLLQRLKKKMYSGIKQVVNAILLLYLSLLILIILFAPEIMKIMATVDYYDGIYVIPPVAGSMFFILLFTMFAPIEHYSLKTKFIGIASTVSALVNVLLNYIFINAFGYLAAGYTTLACYVIYAFAHWIYMKKCCKDDNMLLFDDRKILIMSVVVVSVSIVSALFYSYSTLRYLFILSIILLCVSRRKKITAILAELTKKNNVQ